jgi:hypothetical protein
MVNRHIQKRTQGMNVDANEAVIEGAGYETICSYYSYPDCLFVAGHCIR